jgi:hypothetical protein
VLILHGLLLSSGIYEETEMQFHENEKQEQWRREKEWTDRESDIVDRKIDKNTETYVCVYVNESELIER